MKLLVTGGNGYVGNKLIPELLKFGHKVYSIDKNLFGDYLSRHKNLIKLNRDIRDINKLKIKKIDCIFHLASNMFQPKNLQLSNGLLYLLQCLKRVGEHDNFLFQEPSLLIPEWHLPH